MFEYNYLRRSVLFIPVKVLIAILISIAVINADKPVDIAFYSIGFYGIITVISYISTYVEHLLVTIIAAIALSVLTLFLITKIPAVIILVVYLVIVVLGYLIDIKKIIRFSVLVKNHDKGLLLTESMSKIRGVAAVNGYSIDEALRNAYDPSGVNVSEEQKVYDEFQTVYTSCNEALGKLYKISEDDAHELRTKIASFYDTVELIHKNEVHTLSESDQIIKIKRIIDTVNSVTSEADARINNLSGKGKKEEKPAFDFFDGCKDKESVKKRYRDLMKTYHPDQGNGSENTIKQINDQYNSLLKKY